MPTSHRLSPQAIQTVYVLPEPAAAATKKFASMTTRFVYSPILSWTFFLHGFVHGTDPQFFWVAIIVAVEHDEPWEFSWRFGVSLNFQKQTRHKKRGGHFDWRDPRETGNPRFETWNLNVSVKSSIRLVKPPAYRGWCFWKVWMILDALLVVVAVLSLLRRSFGSDFTFCREIVVQPVLKCFEYDPGLKLVWASGISIRVVLILGIIGVSTFKPCMISTSTRSIE